MTPLDTVLGRLEKVRKAGHRSFTARCPSHPDRTPSLSIKEADDGRVLLYCHTGCDGADVISALGLTWRDLFAGSRR